MTQVVLDRAMLPRIFFQTNSTLAWARCMQRPCTSPADWIITNTNRHTYLNAASVGRAVDGRTYFSASVDEGIIVGLESADGGYDITTLSTCWGLSELRDPAVLLRPADKWRVAFTNWRDGGVAVYSDLP